MHHPGMTVDRVMQIPVAPAGFRTFPPGRVTGPAGRPVLVRAPAEHPPPATVGDAPELFDVDVDHRPRGRRARSAPASAFSPAGQWPGRCRRGSASGNV